MTRKISYIATGLLLSNTLSGVAQTEGDSITYMLDEVVVTVDRRQTELKGNALVTRVGGTQLEHAGTANDVLRQVPMVLGSEGSFEVFGKGTPAIYVNGRLVQDASELARISSGNIRNVEVITNPGAKYDASVKSVINIRTKAPLGDGFSGVIRAQGAVQKFARTYDQANLKYRTGGLEIFANLGYIYGKMEDRSTFCYITRTTRTWRQDLALDGVGHATDLYGKLGFSYMFNRNHSLGAYYSNGLSRSHTDFTGSSAVLADGAPYDILSMSGRQQTGSVPKHYANLYYNGLAGNWSLDFNMDYMWRRGTDRQTNDEQSANFEDELVTSRSLTHSRLFAEKFIVGHPLWKGGIEFGEEFTSSRFASDYSTDAEIVSGADSKVTENNIAGFVELGQQFGRWQVSAGLRYEHVSFDYLENGQKRDDMSRSYNNLFPSLSVATMFGSVRLGLTYTHKTQRPSYGDLDGTVSYINRFTLEGGNPYLKPVKIHNVQLQGTWKRFFGQISYSYLKDPIFHSSVPYADDGKIKLIIMENFPKIQKLEAFIGSQFRVGIWEPKVNLGITKQWLTVGYTDGRKSLGNPVGLIQWQNAIHLPADIWLNVDMQWMSAGNNDNTRVTSMSYLNAKLYKAFFHNSFSISVEANDIFDKGRRDVTMISRDVTLSKSSLNTSRSFILTLQYTFNTTRDRYKGQGAGHNELNRF